MAAGQPAPVAAATAVPMQPAKAQVATAVPMQQPGPCASATPQMQASYGGAAEMVIASGIPPAMLRTIMVGVSGAASVSS